MTTRNTSLGVGVVERNRGRDPTHDGKADVNVAPEVKVYYDVEPSYQPSCSTAQQMVGGLFGFMLGYGVFLLFGPGLILYISLCAGSSFGVLGSRIENPLEIDQNHWARLFVLCCTICWPLYWLAYFNMFGILLLSVLVSILSSQADFYLALMSRRDGPSSSRQSRRPSAVPHELDNRV